MTWANNVLPMFMGPLGLYKPKSIAKERNGFQIVDTPKIAKHHVVIGLFAIDHELNRTLLIQDIVFPGLAQYLSLVFLPHGVKVLATAVAGARAIPGLAVGSGISAYFFWDVTDLRLMVSSTLVAAITAWIVFELLHKIGFNAYFLSLTGQQPPVRNLIAAGILCSAANGALMSVVLASMDQPPSFSWIILTVAVGDLLGLLSAWAMIKFSLHFMLSRYT